MSVKTIFKILEDNNLMKYRDDIYHCVKCHLCKYVDMQVIDDEKYANICPSGSNFKFESYYSSGRIEIARAIINKELIPTKKFLEILYTCSLCGGCESICNLNKNIKPTEIFKALRTWTLKNKIGPLTAHKEVIDNILEIGNPWGYPQEYKQTWVEGYKIPPISDEVEVLLFVGCFIPYDEKIRKIGNAAIEILNKLDIKFGILGGKEVCCGSVIYLIGDQDSFLKIIKKNIKILREIDKPIITICPGCFNMLKNIYNIEEEGLKIFHITQYLNNLIYKRKLKISKHLNINITYHDPCHLGRHSKIYKEPRKLLKRIPGINIIEMKRNQEYSYCCGAGGGMKSAFPEFSLKVAEQRVDEAISTGAELLISSCPFCERNFIETNKINVLDIMELLNQVL
ncbi:MAG: (Fe-S)-binding protein [Candidatus Helarchaeota archaeon]